MKMHTIAAVLIGLLLAGPLRAEEAIRVVIGTKAFTESVILGQMLAALAREAGAKVDLKAELGGTGLVWKALLNGQIDAYVEYTGTLSNEILRDPQLTSKNLSGLGAALAAKGVVMSYPLGFNNSYALGMKESQAAGLGIRTISDLLEHPSLRLGLSDEFKQRPDGWNGLKDRYGLPQLPPRSLDHALALRALAEGQIDVTDLYSTDAEIEKLRLRALIDDRNYFPAYQAVLLTRADLAERAPKVVAAFRRLESAIDTPTMVRLNAAVLVDRKPEAIVAVEFLNKSLELRLPAPPDTGFWVRLWMNGYEHVFLVAVSLTLAVLISIPLGILAYKVPSIGGAVMGFVGVIQTIPSLALLVFLLPLFSMGAGTAIAAMFLYSLLPIVRNTYTGLSTLSPGLKEAAQVLGLPWYARLWRVELPLAMPSILAGIKIAAVVNVGTATIGAMVSAGGYGQPIIAGLRLSDTSLILQGAIPAALLALIVQGGFSLLEKVLVPRGLRLDMAQ